MSDEVAAPEATTTTVAGWKKSAKHPVLCPSGVRVEIRIPDLPLMIESGEIPQHLLEAALGVAGSNGATPSIELIKQQREFTDNLVMKTVVAPRLTEADMAEIPYEDKDFLVSVATRQRDIDAEGEHIAGLTKSEKFRRFRRLGEFSEDVADA
jgi:hypothetical protein